MAGAEKTKSHERPRMQIPGIGRLSESVNRIPDAIRARRLDMGSASVRCSSAKSALVHDQKLYVVLDKLM